MGSLSVPADIISDPFSENVPTIPSKPITSLAVASLPPSRLPKSPLPVILKGNDLLKPYKDLEEFPLRRNVETTLKCWKAHQLNSLQLNCWPHVLAGRNCFIIGGNTSKQGKTLSYLVPIAAKVLMDTDLAPEGQVSGCGPLGIILCGSLNAGKKIETQLNTLFQHHKLTVYHGSKDDPEFDINLDKNPDFIICTPDFLIYIADYRFFIFGRLQYLTVDDCHQLLQENFAQINEILQTLSHQADTDEQGWLSSRPDESDAHAVQFIFCGQDWNDAVKNATTLIDNPVIVISSLFQAMVYGNVKLCVQPGDDFEKYRRLSELIVSGTAKHVVIVCQTYSTVVKVAVKLYRSNGVLGRYLRAELGDEEDQIERLRSVWNNRCTAENTVIIATDEDLNKLGLGYVSTLVHFEMPLRKLPAFSERHVCMWDLFPDHELTSYVFLESTDPYLHKIITLFQGVKAVISPELEKVPFED